MAERVFERMKHFLRNTDVNSLERASDWKIWCEKIDKLMPMMKRFSDRCHELNENLAKHTNWDDLPEEMKLECISRMDFSTRIALRRTRRSEKVLVDSKRFKLERLNVEAYGNVCLEIQLRADRVMKCKSTPKVPFDTILRSLLYILKHCEINLIVFESHAHHSKNGEKNSVDLMLPEFQSIAPFHFFNIRIDITGDARIPILLIENCVFDIETLEIRASEQNQNTILAMTQPFRAKKVSIYGNYGEGFLTEIFARLIELDPPMYYSLDLPGDVDTLMENFEDRIFEDDEGFVQFHMNDPKKHILANGFSTLFLTVIDVDDLN